MYRPAPPPPPRRGDILLRSRRKLFRTIVTTLRKRLIVTECGNNAGCTAIISGSLQRPDSRERTSAAPRRAPRAIEPGNSYDRGAPSFIVACFARYEPELDFFRGRRVIARAPFPQRARRNRYAEDIGRDYRAEKRKKKTHKCALSRANGISIRLGKELIDTRSKHDVDKRWNNARWTSKRNSVKSTLARQCQCCLDVATNE